MRWDYVRNYRTIRDILFCRNFPTNGCSSRHCARNSAPLRVYKWATNYGFMIDNCHSNFPFRLKRPSRCFLQDQILDRVRSLVRPASTQNMMTSTLAKTLVLALCLALTAASDVQFENRCGYTVQVVQTSNGQQPFEICNLNSGATCAKRYNSGAMNFKVSQRKSTIMWSSFDTHFQLHMMMSSKNTKLNYCLALMKCVFPVHLNR